MPISPTPPTIAPTSDFDIKIVYSVPVSDDIKRAFDDAVAKWRSVIVGDLGGDRMTLNAGAFVCNGWDETRLTESVTWDDLIIMTTIAEIDGPSGTLGYAGPCRTMNGDIRAGAMTFDIADVNNMIRSGSFHSVILHEMGHVLGIGASSKFAGLLQERSGSTPLSYTGAEGIAGLADIGGSGLPVVEETGGSGTARGHWDEDEYQNELMTGYLSGETSPMSMMTARSLRDLGYVVSTDNVDDFTVPTRRRRLSNKQKEQDAQMRSKFHLPDHIEHDIAPYTVIEGGDMISTPKE